MTENTRPLKVLMMGGRRCGKTSALASLFEQMTNGQVNKYFTVSDTTQLETKGFEVQDSLNDKSLELQNMLESNNGNSNIFLVDQNPTSNFWLYTLHIQIPGTHREMDIEFRDSAGEFFEKSGNLSSETEEYIKDCDVFVIIIDTPYLMGPCEENTKEICTESINKGTNRIQDIQDFLANINNHEGKDAKMVAFVPLKCEKWAKEPGGLDRVTARVKDVYGSLIRNLKAYEKMYISIIPMQTAGNIIFSEMRKAYKYKNFEGEGRCCKICDDIIRDENGENHPIMDGDILNEDPESIISGTHIMRPYSWYHINTDSNKFEPINCDQLPLHIIRFMLAKLMDAEVNSSSEERGFFGFLKSLINRLKSIFGSMDTDELKKIIGQMQRDNIIKDNGEGIEIIKKF